MASECPFIVIDELDDYDDEDEFIKKPRTENFNGNHATSSNTQNFNDVNSDSESEDSDLDEIQIAKDDKENEQNEDVVFIDVKGEEFSTKFPIKTKNVHIWRFHVIFITGDKNNEHEASSVFDFSSLSTQFQEIDSKSNTFQSAPIKTPAPAMTNHRSNSNQASSQNFSFNKSIMSTGWETTSPRHDVKMTNGNSEHPPTTPTRRSSWVYIWLNMYF